MASRYEDSNGTQEQENTMTINTGDPKHDELIQAVTETRQRVNDGTATQDELITAQHTVNEYHRAKTAEMQQEYMKRIRSKVTQ